MESNSAMQEERSAFPWDLGVCDAHCHPTDSMNQINNVAGMKAKVLTIMATRSQDQGLVSQVARRFELGTAETEVATRKVVPAFGWHPWFSHQIYDDTRNHTGNIDKQEHYESVLTGDVPNPALIDSFPNPRPLSDLINRTRQFLHQHPLAMVGEIGLDRTFRIPKNFDPREQLDLGSDLTPGGREGRRLTSHRVDINHQRLILMAQLRLAGELSRAVSVHGVAAHGLVYDTLRATWKGHEKRVVSRRLQKRRGSVSGAHAHEQAEEEDARNGGEGPKPYPPRICLHSYSGPPETLKQYLAPEVPAEVFFSFSQIINFSTSASLKAIEVIKALPDDRLLVESDLHCAGDRMDSLLEDMIREICRIREWSLEEGVMILRRNWERFAFGNAG